MCSSDLAYENGWKKTETSRTVTDALIAALEQAEQTEDVKYPGFPDTYPDEQYV